MRRFFSFTLILMLSVSVYAAEGDPAAQTPLYTQYAYANLSFTANLHSIFGFSDSPVDSAIQPDVMADEIHFKYTGNNIIETDLFYVYYLIFSPKKIKVTLSVKEYMENGVSQPPSDVSWSNVTGDISFGTDDKVAVVFEDVSSNNAQPRIGSKSLILQMDDLGNINWDTPYKWSLVMNITQE